MQTNSGDPNLVRSNVEIQHKFDKPNLEIQELVGQIYRKSRFGGTNISKFKIWHIHVYPHNYKMIHNSPRFHSIQQIFNKLN